MSTIWDLKLAGFLHDPPDKALRIVGHEERRDKFIMKTLGINMSSIAERADHIASAMQRINIFEETQLTIDYASRSHVPRFHHTLSAQPKELEIDKWVSSQGYEKCLINESWVQMISKMKTSDPKMTYYKMWRLLPFQDERYADLPAETRIPDHTIWDHLDVASALAPTIEKGAALLAFKVTPVQEFIEKSRTTADLWAGSHILSYLVFKALTAVIEEFGPDAVVFPHLREQPLMDQWLNNNQIDVEYDRKALEVSNIPNTFLAIVSRDNVRYIAERVRQYFTESWKQTAANIKEELVKKGIQHDECFEQIWKRQIKNAFQVTVTWLEWPFPMHTPEPVDIWFKSLKNNGGLPFDLMDKYDNRLQQYGTKRVGLNAGALYGLYCEILGHLLKQKSMSFENEQEPEEEGAKLSGRCSCCGVRNPVRTKDASVADYWKNIQKHSSLRGLLRNKERLCAVCLVKRLYRSYFAEEFKARKEFWSVASIATRSFAKECIKNKDIAEDFLDLWNTEVGTKIGMPYKIDELDLFEGEWFYKESYTLTHLSNYNITIESNKIEEFHKRLSELYKAVYGKERSPPKYYAILMMDGDEIGKKLRGESLEAVSKFLHPSIRQQLERNEKCVSFLESKRLLTPNVHMAVSRALKDFSIKVVGKIIRKYQGDLIYSGGDDLLALLPAENALEAAKEINEAFGQDFFESDGKKIMLMGKGSTMSTGIVYAHYSYPLYDALAKARRALKDAKTKYRRQAFVLMSLKRSGQITSAGSRWRHGKLDIAQSMLDIASKVAKEERIFPKFIYELLQEATVLNGISEEALSSYLRYLLARHVNEKKVDCTTKRELVNSVINTIVNTVQSFMENTKETSKEREKGTNAIFEVGNMLKILYEAKRGD